jgi:galactoside O-acetyltransferase
MIELKKIVKIFFEFYLLMLSAMPTSIGAKIRFFAYKPLFKKIGKSVSIDCRVTITGFNNIELGDNINIMKNSFLYAEDGILKIGNNFSMNSNSQLGSSGGKILIGDDVSIGPNCVFRAANHRFTRTDIPINRQGHSYGEIIVGNDIWFGANCVVTPNTKIGNGVIVAAGAVVVKDMPSYSIAAGVPARVIGIRKKQKKL